MKRNKSLKKTVQENSIISGLIVCVIFYFVSCTLDTILNKKKFVDSMLDIMKSVSNFIKTVLLFGVPVWIIVIAIIVIILIINIFEKNTIDQKPRWIDYTEDNIKEWKFRWAYTPRTHEIDQLRPICMKCSCELTRKDRISSEYGYGSFLVCPNCGSIYRIPNEYDRQDVINLIIHRANDK